MTISIIGSIAGRFANAFLNISGNGLLLIFLLLIFFIVLLAFMGLDIAVSAFVMIGVTFLAFTYAGLPPFVYYIALGIGGLFVMMALAKIMRR